MTPNLWRTSLRLASTPVAAQLTNLSPDQLREWTIRRALIPADVKPRTKGAPAKYSWQTILVLRIAFTLRNTFNIELQTLKYAFRDLRKTFRATSFLALWGQKLILRGAGNWSLCPVDEALDGDGLCVCLDPHLIIIRDRFALPDARTVSGQLDLFSLPAMHRKQMPRLNTGVETTEANRLRPTAARRSS